VKWEELDPAGGALFLVGDPKQSIYRFRRADVETWRQVAARFGPAARKSLTTSFRAAPGLVSYVNAVFSRVFAGSDESWDVDYAPLCPSPDKAASASPNVLHLVPPEAGEEEPEEGADLRGLALEARAVANLLRERFAGRPRGWEGIAVLVSRNDSIDVFEEALREAGIPAVLEGGASFYRRQETAAVVQALRAIDDPANGIAATAALKSFLFGLTDVELLDAVESGARLDAPDAGPIPGPVGDAFALLRRLRDARLARPLAETILDLLDSRAAFPSIRAGAVVHRCRPRRTSNGSSSSRAPSTARGSRSGKRSPGSCRASRRSRPSRAPSRRRPTPSASSRSTSRRGSSSTSSSWPTSASSSPKPPGAADASSTSGAAGAGPSGPRSPARAAGRPASASSTRETGAAFEPRRSGSSTSPSPARKKRSSSPGSGRGG
jgi:hypothetical protein